MQKEWLHERYLGDLNFSIQIGHTLSSLTVVVFCGDAIFMFYPAHSETKGKWSCKVLLTLFRHGFYNEGTNSNKIIHFLINLIDKNVLFSVGEINCYQMCPDLISVLSYMSQIKLKRTFCEKIKSYILTYILYPCPLLNKCLYVNTILHQRFAKKCSYIKMSLMSQLQFCKRIIIFLISNQTTSNIKYHYCGNPL